MTNKKSKSNGKRQYRDLSAAAAKAPPPVEMTEG
jgi:hypothetical protein